MPEEALLSGSAVANREAGWRGLVAQANHDYAHLVQTISSGRPVNPNDVLFSTTSTTLVQCTGQEVVEIGADIQSVRIWADVADAGMGITSNLGTNSSGAAITGRGTVSFDLALNNTTGVDMLWWLELKARSGQTGFLYGYLMLEVPMVAGDFP